MFPNVMDLSNFFPNENNPFVYNSWIAKLKGKEYTGKPYFLCLNSLLESLEYEFKNL